VDLLFSAIIVHHFDLENAYKTLTGYGSSPTSERKGKSLFRVSSGFPDTTFTAETKSACRIAPCLRLKRTDATGKTLMPEADITNGMKRFNQRLD
jgi:hypothetical protein